MRVKTKALQIYILVRLNVLPKCCYILLRQKIASFSSKARHGTSLVVNQGVFEVDSGLEPGHKPQ